MKVLVNSLQGISQVVSRYPDTPWVSPNPGIKPRSPALSLNSLPSEPRGKPTQTYMQSEWLPTPVFLLGKSRGQRSLVDYSPWGCKGLDMTEGTEHICICRCMCVYICVCVCIYIYIYLHLYSMFSCEIQMHKSSYLCKDYREIYKITHSKGLIS